MVREAGLYVYEHHGSEQNTWGEKHFQGLIKTYGVGALSEPRLRELGWVP